MENLLNYKKLLSLFYVGLPIFLLIGTVQVIYDSFTVSEAKFVRVPGGICICKKLLLTEF